MRVRASVVLAFAAAIACLANGAASPVTTREQKMKEKLKYFDQKVREIKSGKLKLKDFSKRGKSGLRGQKPKKGGPNGGGGDPVTNAPCVNGEAGGFPCQGIDLVSVTSLSDQGSSASLGSDIWGWTDTDGKEYALTTFMDGFGVVDVTDPVSPSTLLFIPSQNGQTSYWRDVKTYRNAAYIVADSVGNHGMQVFNLEKVRDIARGQAPLAMGADLVYTEVGSAHNVFVNEDTGFGYIVGSDTCGGGLHIFDANSNPLNPTFVGCYQADGYVHDVQCVVYNGPDSTFAGREVCFCYNEDHVQILDVTDKTVSGGQFVNFNEISQAAYPGTIYTHQGWTTEDQSFLLVGDEGNSNTRATSRMIVFNIANLANPVYETTFGTSDTTIDHNLYVKGGLVYSSNYQTGLRIRDVSQINNNVNSIAETAYFDTWPQSERRTTWDGVWSSYPYLASGNVLISSQEYGLIVVKLQ